MRRVSWRDTGTAMYEISTSRGVNIAADVAEVRAICSKHHLTISAIETLLSGGTRVVLQSGEDAVSLRRTMKTKLIDGSVQRVAWASHRGGAT